MSAENLADSPVRESYRVGIKTKYLGPTNHRGSRIKATRCDHHSGDPSYTHHWDYSLSSSGNHAAAVAGFIDMMGWAEQGQSWWIGSSTDGVVAVCVPKEES